jgi:hypothetical protein
MPVIQEPQRPKIEDLNWEVYEKQAAQAILDSIPEEHQAQHKRRAKWAPRRPSDAIFLKCMDCCCWDRKEVQRCRITGCSLHAHRTRLFRPRTPRVQAASQAA